jgi:hypothetical protein
MDQPIAPRGREEGRPELLEAFASALPSPPQSSATAQRILEVMHRISGATSFSLYRERTGTLRRVAGQRLSESAVCAVRAAMRHERGKGRLSTIWTGEPGTEGWVRSWVLWSGRSHDQERDVVLLQGQSLRPAAATRSRRLERLMALLSDLP